MVVGVVHEILVETRHLKDDLGMQGVMGKRYAKACLAMKNARDVLLVLEDVLCNILVDDTGLQLKYDSNNFSFQQLWYGCRVAVRVSYKTQ